MNGDSRPEPIGVEARATGAGYRLARRSLKGQLVWWWQLLDDPDDTRQPCWLEEASGALVHGGCPRSRRDWLARLGGRGGLFEDLFDHFVSKPRWQLDAIKNRPDLFSAFCFGKFSSTQNSTNLGCDNDDQKQD